MGCPRRNRTRPREVPPALDPKARGVARADFALFSRFLAHARISVVMFGGAMQNDAQPNAGAGQPPAPEYENKRQLAARLGVSVRTIDNLLTRGLPHLKLTRKLTRFP